MSISGDFAKQVIKTCAVGHQCILKAEVDHCRGAHGACIEVTRVVSASFGKALPMCTASASADRANEWWQNNSSILVRGMIVPSKTVSTHGRTDIVMDLVTCSSGAPMAVSRVPERHVGHFVEVGGTAFRENGDWFIQARAVKDAD